MRHSLLLAGLIWISTSSLMAQDLDNIQVGGISLKNIKYLIQDTTGVYFHPKLVERFQTQPKSLTKTDYLMLYFGYAFSPDYDPYFYYGLEDSLSQLTDQQKGTEALALADQILAKNPVSVFALVEKAYALNALGKENEALKYLERYQILMEMIETSGEGSSYANPIVLISPKDAEAFLLKYRLDELSRSINGENNRYYSVFLVRNKDEKQFPIYFDITIPRTIGIQKLMQKQNNSEE